MIKPNWIRIFGLFLSLCLSAVFASAAPAGFPQSNFPQNSFPQSKAVQPSKSQWLSSERGVVKRYIPLNQSDAELRNVVARAVRAVGSHTDRKIHVVWTTAATEQSAVRIANGLKAKQIAPQQIVIRKSRYARDIYPLSVEVHTFEGRNAGCRSATAEDMMSFDPYEYCAFKHNFKAQLKTP